MGTPTFVAKRFLHGRNGDAVNADHIVRIYVSPDGKLYAGMTNGADIELATDATVAGPLPAMPVMFVGIG